MAVQAQYPSNVLLLNRNGQEGCNDYSLQPQPGGFLEQPHMLFHNGGANTNPRKRGREVTAADIGSGSITAQTIHQFSMGTQPPQLIDLSQLHHQTPPNAISTGLRLSFGEQQQQHQLHQQNSHFHHQRHQQQEQQQQSQTNLTCQSSAFLSVLSEDFTTQIKRQRDELDQFLQAQGEHLRRILHEKRQRHYRSLLCAAEETMVRRLREKEAEVEKASRQNAELEAREAQLKGETQVWKAKARAQEATAASLQAQLQRAIMNGGGGGEEGVGGTGEGMEGQAEDAESAYVDPDRVTAVSVGPTCKACRKRVASVVLLSCRHLCVCTECDQVVDACPLCFQVRNSSVEVFLY
ncbi:hypothetical protein K2173_003737 [Erythroxylum novogranatense]|uniref:RING-type domain-containing protein n=1 Tax=Erythroxylum novogranatense TaxID=1862640 RepID=A0AAV8TCE1_9ROSI|nr:hypothetical protein K2173_003737 [Erythroxylum novogranatense]